MEKTKNLLTTIDNSYIKPDQSVDTILVSDGNKNRVVYSYNFKGIGYILFISITQLINYFEGNGESEKAFYSEDEMDKYLEEMDLIA